MEGASEQSLWQGCKDFLSERFRILDSYHPYIRRENPLPSWSASDVEEFIASYPVHAPYYDHSSLFIYLRIVFISL